jgi:SRSO17 transposase
MQHAIGPAALMIEHLKWMLQRAIDARVPSAWVTSDEAYGQVTHFRVLLEEHRIAHVLAMKVNDTVITTDGRVARVDELIAAIPKQTWKRISAGSEPTASGSTTGPAWRSDRIGRAASDTGCSPAAA